MKNGCGADPRFRAPRREELAAATVEIMREGLPSKPDIYRVDLGEGPLLVKDYARKGPWKRFTGRFEISHECRAYERLGPRSFLPAFAGKIDRLALAVELVDAGPVSEAPDRYRCRVSYFSRLRTIFDELTGLGFLHLDARARRNVLVQGDGHLILVDLAGSMWWPEGRLGSGLFRRFAAFFYKATLLKWKRLLSPGRAPLDGQEMRYRAGLRDLRRLLRFPERARKKKDGR